MSKPNGFATLKGVTRVIIQQITLLILVNPLNLSWLLEFDVHQWDTYMIIRCLVNAVGYWWDSQMESLHPDIQEESHKCPLGCI